MESKSNLVSIVIATFNRSQFLPGAIQSALAQTHADCEVVVVDDGSDDNTAEVVEKLFGERVAFFRLTQNEGMVHAFGRGLREARGEFVVLLNDDDILFPEFVANRMARMSTDQQIIAVFSKYDVRDANGKLVRVNLGDATEEESFDSLELLRAALSRQWFLGASMYRTQPVKKVWPELPDERCFLDLPLHVLLAIRELGTGLYIPHIDFVWTMHPGQISQTKQNEMTARAIAVLERFLKEPLPLRYFAMIRQEIAFSHILLGRRLAARGSLLGARNHFAKAVKTSPWLFEPWKQLGVSLLWPSRLVASSRRQWGTD